MIRLWIQEALASPPFAIVYADLDRFKEYNDRYGFVMGDEMIRFTARLLGEKLAGLSSGGTRLGHLGGDDFVMVCAGPGVRARSRDPLPGFRRGPDRALRPGGSRARVFRRHRSARSGGRGAARHPESGGDRQPAAARRHPPRPSSLSSPRRSRRASRGSPRPSGAAPSPSSGGLSGLSDPQPGNRRQRRTWATGSGRAEDLGLDDAGAAGVGGGRHDVIEARPDRRDLGGDLAVAEVVGGRASIVRALGEVRHRLGDGSVGKTGEDDGLGVLPHPDACGAGGAAGEQGRGRSRAGRAPSAPSTGRSRPHRGAGSSPRVPQAAGAGQKVHALSQRLVQRTAIGGHHGQRRVGHRAAR